MTDIGTLGNARIASTYAAYLAKAAATAAAAAPTAPPAVSAASVRQVLVSGFGLFAGCAANISGLLAARLGAPTSPLAPRLSAADCGGRRTLRRVDPDETPDRRPLVLTTLVLDVAWDLAAAILVHEIEAAAPEFVLMLGRGHEAAVFERGACNRARPLSGFAADGCPLADSLPCGSVVTPADPPDAALSLSWDAGAAHAGAADAIAALGFEARLAGGARLENDYICNNVSYHVQCAANGQALALAGGALVLRPRWRVTPRVGFLHLPAAASCDEPSVDAWLPILKAVIASQCRD